METEEELMENDRQFGFSIAKNVKGDVRTIGACTDILIPTHTHTHCP